VLNLLLPAAAAAATTATATSNAHPASLSRRQRQRQRRQLQAAAAAAAAGAAASDQHAGSKPTEVNPVRSWVVPRPVIFHCATFSRRPGLPAARAFIPRGGGAGNDTLGRAQGAGGGGVL
jgi:hypothetical protein